MRGIVAAAAVTVLAGCAGRPTGVLLPVAAVEPFSGTGECTMARHFGLAVLAGMSAWVGTIQAQGLERGAQEGANRGEMIAGPLGAVVGGAVEAAVGTANGILGIDRRERFRIYATGERRPSFAYPGHVKVGTVLPEDGVVDYNVPPEFALPSYNYTVVNEHPVLVDPRTRRVVEVID